MKYFDFLKINDTFQYSINLQFDIGNINKIKEYIPDCTVTTDIIVGFPNETHEQYLDLTRFWEILINQQY